MLLEAYTLAALACFHVNVREGVSNVRFPTLVIWGEQDEKTPRVLSEELVKVIRNSEFKTVPGAARLSSLDNPAAFKKILAKSLGLPSRSLERKKSAGTPVGTLPREAS